MVAVLLCSQTGFLRIASGSQERRFSREGKLPNTFMSNKQMQKRSEMPQKA